MVVRVRHSESPGKPRLSDILGPHDQNPSSSTEEGDLSVLSSASETSDLQNSRRCDYRTILN